ncbi:3-methyladenine DNA glycosylase [Spelaeicoccus albus]|uniref:3-methyladenine DNA glycosylase n=1 Tax=Spelaeicoccus albus TaxID=1280376 RepID=A0A7Z0D2K0_9MICO|nr:3-methyladenine DNA glycosylase [Spelaeicoccus albus]NYI67707.1 hypothetical protein [Spelaeicoccus albus]
MGEFLNAADWRCRADAHAERANELTRARRDRTARGLTEPVDDFLYTYYPYRPAQLRRWHPGAGVVLAGAGERASWRWYRPVGRTDDAEVDIAAFVRERGSAVRYIADLLRRTAGRPGRFGCFGMHEWAMVYRSDKHGTRHPIPLRLGADETDRVVESSRISCTHFDAFRFFTPDAVPRNELAPTRRSAPDLEQPGCLHAGMDIYKWATKLGPLVPGNLLLDAFELARDIRVLDMRAAPYDLSAWGYTAVPVETPAGKAQYVAAQRGFARRGNELRDRLVTALAPAEALADEFAGGVAEQPAGPTPSGTTS